MTRFKSQVQSVLNVNILTLTLSDFKYNKTDLGMFTLST